MQISHQTGPTSSRQRPQSSGQFSTSTTSSGSSSSSNGSHSYNPTIIQPVDSIISITPTSPVSPNNPLSSPKMHRDAHSPLPQAGSDSYSYRQQSPNQSPHSRRRNSPSRYNRSPQGSVIYMDRSPSPSPTMPSSPRPAPLHSPSNLLNPYDSTQMGRRSPRADRGPSPLSFHNAMSNTLPRNFRQPSK